VPAFPQVEAEPSFLFLFSMTLDAAVLEQGTDLAFKKRIVSFRFNTSVCRKHKRLE
jgi:hypothetical protein